MAFLIMLYTILSVGGYVLICSVWGFCCKKIVADKGYEKWENKGFLWGAFLGIIGLIVCAAKPQKPINGTPTEELVKYQQLLEMAALTNEEFNMQREKLMKFI